METEENPDLEKVKELMEECEYEEAEKILKPLFKKDPNNVEILDYLGELYLNIGNFKGSKKMLEKSINLKPDDNPDKYMDYAQLLDIPIQRVEAYKKAIELYIMKLKNNKSKKSDNKNNDTNESISSAYASIVSLYMTTDLCEDPNAENICENSIKEALKYCPESIDALLQFSNLRIIRKRDNEAKEAMFKILEKIKKIEKGENIEQSLPERDILINLSQNFAELKMFKEACYIINTLIKRDDEDIECYYLLAVYEDSYRNFFSAMEALDKFNKIYMKMQKKKEEITPVLQQYVESAKALYNKLSKIKKENLVDENPDDEDNDEEDENMEEDDDEDEEMK